MDNKTVSLFGIPRRYCYALLDMIDNDLVTMSQLSYYQECFELLAIRERIDDAIHSTYAAD